MTTVDEALAALREQTRRAHERLDALGVPRRQPADVDGAVGITLALRVLELPERLPDAERAEGLARVIDEAAGRAAGGGLEPTAAELREWARRVRALNREEMAA